MHHLHCFNCSPDRSYCICGPNFKGVGNDDFYEARSSFGVQVVQVSFSDSFTLNFIHVFSFQTFVGLLWITVLYIYIS